MRVLFLLSLVLFFSATFAKKRHLLKSRHLETAPSSAGVVFPTASGWTIQKESTFKYAQYVLQNVLPPTAASTSTSDDEARAWLEKYSPSQYWKGLMAWGLVPQGSKTWDAMFIVAVWGEDGKRKYHYIRINNFQANRTLYIKYIGTATENCEEYMRFQKDKNALKATCAKWAAQMDLARPAGSSKAKTPADSSSSKAKTPAKLSSSLASTFTLAAFALFAAML